MLKLNTLGGLTIVDERGVQKSLPAQRTALVALLAVAGERGIARDRVAALLWPESTDENARHSLGQSLYALRRDANSADAVLGTTTLRANPEAFSCDAWEMESLVAAGGVERAVALYSGPFLDGVHLRGSADLEQAIDVERGRLAGIYRDALASLARASEARGEPRDAVAWRRRLAAADPLSSQVALDLIRALVNAGDKSAALQAARVHETLLRQELDTEPDATLLEYVRTLRARTSAGTDTAATDTAATESLLPSSPASVPYVADMTSSPMDSADVPATRRARSRGAMWGVVALATAAVAFAGAKWYLGSSATPDEKRIYVAPFENRTGDASLQSIGGMTSDWVTQGLEQSGIIRVVASPRYGGEGGGPVDSSAVGSRDVLAEPAGKVGAGTIISGAYYAVGDSLRIHVEISDVARGEVVAAFDVTGAGVADPTGPIEVVRQRTIGALASLFDPRLQSWVRVATKPPTYEAYRAFVTGQSIWANDYRRALSHFERAVALDSTFYAARVEAAILHRLLGECDRTNAIATDLAKVRLRLAPYDYHALDAQVALCRGDWERAYEETRTVAQLRPGSPFLDYAVALQAMQLGRDAEAAELLARHELDRGVTEIGPNFAAVVAILRGRRGDFDGGVSIVRGVQRRFPTFTGLRTAEAALLARGGGIAESERVLDSIAVLPLRPSLAALQALRRIPTVYAMAGDTAAAARGLTRALAWIATRPAPERDDRAFQFELAQLYYDVGRYDDAAAIFTTLHATDTTNVGYRAYLGLIAARRNDVASASAADQWLATARPPYVFTRTFYRARLAAVAGRRDDALALFAAALDEMGRFNLQVVAENSDFASLRDDARFRRLAGVR